MKIALRWVIASEARDPGGADAPPPSRASLGKTWVALLVVACATAPPADERLDVDASLLSESALVSYYRVIVRNSSARPLTIEMVEIQPIGGTTAARAFLNARTVLAPGRIETFNISTEIHPRDFQREQETTGGVVVSSTRARGGKAEARVYVTFRDGTVRNSASYKVEL